MIKDFLLGNLSENFKIKNFDSKIIEHELVNFG